MRKRTGAKAAITAAAVGTVMLAGAASSWADQQITVRDANGYPGAFTPFVVRLESDCPLVGNVEEPCVAATSNDIKYPADAAIAERIDAMTTLTADIGPKTTAIPVADASGLPDFGIVVIGEEQIAYGSRSDTVLNVADDSMVCNPAGTTPPDCTEDAMCGTGQLCVPAGRGQNGTTAAEHANGAEVGLPSQIPDCSPTEDLLAAGKSAVFSFLPSGCVPSSTETPCSSIRGIVIALDNTDAMPLDLDLYTCNVQSKALPPGNQGLRTLVCPTGDNVEDPNEAAASTSPPPPTPLATNCADGTIGLCIGDCRGDGTSDLGTTQALFSLFLGDPATCPAREGNPNEVDLGEVQTAFDNFLNDCPQ